MKKRYLSLFLLAGTLASCSPTVIGRTPWPMPREGGREGGKLSLEYLGIPNGHMPPPGSCRIWYPGRPAGQQPPPFKCGGFLRVPLGAFLVQRLDQQMIQVDEYDSRRENYVVRSEKMYLN